MFIIVYLFAMIVPKKVVLHLEKIPNGITHAGISFRTPHKAKRYDFRAFNKNRSCLTSGLDRNDPKVIFPDIYEEDFNPKIRNCLEDFLKMKPNAKVIYLDVDLGTTDKTFQEIEMYSRIVNRKYIFGFYDCRHFVNRMTQFVGVGNIPIWRLNNFFKKYPDDIVIK